MYTAETIANWFLLRAKFDYDMGYSDELISNLKLQKLLYYAQGCILGLTGKPLFPEEIQAWEHGPVIPAIYHKYKDYGKNGLLPDETFDRNSIDEETNAVLENVYETFGQFSAWKLRDMTHQEAPWQETKKNHVISKDVIKKYFQENYVERP